MLRGRDDGNSTASNKATQANLYVQNYQGEYYKQVHSISCRDMNFCFAGSFAQKWHDMVEFARTGVYFDTRSPATSILRCAHRSMNRIIFTEIG
jgi:hypothetical protein